MTRVCKLCKLDVIKYRGEWLHVIKFNSFKKEARIPERGMYCKEPVIK